MQWIGLLSAFMATIFWACSAFPFTKAGRLMTVPAMNLLRLALGTLLVLSTAMLFESRSICLIFSANYAAAWLWLGLSGLISLGIGDYFSYRMYSILSPRYGAVFTSISPASALLFGHLLLNETMHLLGIAGMVITIAGVMSMSFSRKERNSIPDHGQGTVVKGIVFGTMGALCHGIGLVFSKNGFLLQANLKFPIAPVTGSFIRFFTAAVIVIIFLFLNKKLAKQIRIIRHQSLPVLRTALSAILLGPVLAVSCAMISIQYINVAISQTIFALVPVVVLVIAHYLYKEKITRHALLGVLLALAGVSILVWRNEIINMMQ